MKILYLDIETSALNVDTWSPWESNAIVINREWQVLGFAYAWDDGKVRSVYPPVDQPASEEGELDVLTELWAVLDEADIVIAHNGDGFDLRKINARLIRAGYGPPSPYLTIDTLKVAKKHFAFTYNRLDYLGRYLGLGHKLSHQGYPMWQGCMEGDPKAWRKMAKYNKQDIVLLRDVYKVMLPWISNHPHMGGDGCPSCGAHDAQKRGTKTMKSGIQYQQYQCNVCGSYYRDRKAESSPATRSA